MDNSTTEDINCTTHGNVDLGFLLATAAGLMTFVGAFTVFIPIKPRYDFLLNIQFCYTRIFVAKDLNNFK